mgnify:CR=1 FL=1
MFRYLSVDSTKTVNSHLLILPDFNRVFLLFMASYLVRTDPRDVARVESKTFICTKEKSDAIPTPKEGVQGQLGNWMSESDMEKALGDRFPGCMKGKTVVLSHIFNKCLISLYGIERVFETLCNLVLHFFFLNDFFKQFS